ncbi:MAG: alpha/beta hydrolase [Bdellovibrionaceae bacterium]|nr:alpha/beta hydrolase [Pseudobdellovibrionaceae bacterium]NUM59226.1 alpha/beta hydrolase [Pseudobdellovibrionaceae bacterium]
MKKNLVIPLLVGLLLNQSTANAISENLLNSNTSFALSHWFESHFTKQSFKTKEGVNLVYKKLTISNPKGALFFIHGKSEFSYKYAELFFDISNWGYDIYFMDQRGFGESDRLSDKTQKAYVDNFGKYVDDYDSFIKKELLNKKYTKKILITHSMGGAVALGILERYPNLFNKVFMSAPMFKINTLSYSDSQVILFLTSLMLLGKAKESLPTIKEIPKIGGKEYQLTSSKIRFSSYLELIKRRPELMAGGATIGWSFEALNYIWDLRRRSINTLTTPILILQAGRDVVVDFRGQDEICQNNPGYCKIIKFPESYHELFFEKDEIRNQVIKILYDYVES